MHVERRRERFDAFARRLDVARAADIQARRTEIARLHERVGVFAIRAQRAFERLLDDRAARVERAERLLAAVSYRGVLARGFALVRDLAGRPLRQAAAVSAGERIDIEFSDGRVRALAEVSASDAPAPSQGILRRRRRRPTTPKSARAACSTRSASRSYVNAPAIRARA